MITKLQQKKLDFLEETVNFYNLDNRCIDHLDHCKYYVQGKAGCAIGRHIEDKELCKRFDNLPNDSVDYVFTSLPVSLIELEQNFLHFIQKLHDLKENWSQSGLSKNGRHKYNTIKSRILNGSL